MSDAPFYAPNRTHAVRRSRPGELLWTMVRHGVTWSAELRDHGEWGTEAQVLRDGELRSGRRFPRRDSAVMWAERQRAAL